MMTFFHHMKEEKDEEMADGEGDDDREDEYDAYE